MQDRDSYDCFTQNHIDTGEWFLLEVIDDISIQDVSGIHIRLTFPTAKARCITTHWIKCV